MDKIGIHSTINNILTDLGYSKEDASVAPNLWELRLGSVLVTIAYNKDTGFVFGDAILCSLPEKPSYNLLTFLLLQNNEQDKIRLSVKEREIVLSWSAYDKYFSQETGGAFIKEHMEKADYLDKILVADYGCKWFS